jgi:hypothetical protein
MYSQLSAGLKEPLFQVLIGVVQPRSVTLWLYSGPLALLTTQQKKKRVVKGLDLIAVRTTKTPNKTKYIYIKKNKKIIKKKRTFNKNIFS